jgi:predicted GTPase
MLNLGGRFAERFPGAPISSLMNKCDRKAASADQLAKAGQVFSTTHQCSAMTGEGVLQALNHILGQLASSRA